MRSLVVMLVPLVIGLTGCSNLQFSLTKEPSASPSLDYAKCYGTAADTDAWQSVAGTTATCLPTSSLGTVTDDLGTYSRSQCVTPDVKVVRNNAGIPLEDLTSAFDFFCKFVTSEVMDSIALDNPAQWEKWKSEVAPQYIAADKLDEILSAGDNATNDPLAADIIMTNRANHGTQNQYLSTLLRDGGLRVFNKEMVEIDTKWPTNDGIEIRATVAEIAVMDDLEAAKFVEIASGHEPTGETVDLLPGGSPYALKIIGSIDLTLTKTESGWKIVAFQNSYSYQSDTFLEGTPARLLELRQ